MTRNPTDSECLFYGSHRWFRMYRGATLDVYGCSCGARKTTEGTALEPRKSVSNFTSNSHPNA